jgi:large subunit ribosomal protein L6
MSRLGRKPIELPKGVTLTAVNGAVTVKGPKGELKRTVPTEIDILIAGTQVQIARKGDSRDERARHGLVRALLANMVTGVNSGFERKLEINGVGYRAEVAGQKMTLLLGYSHPVVYELPKGVSAKVDKNIIILSASDREVLGETAAKLRSFRPPEPYKGKGVKYLEETIRRKVGKTGAS